MKKKLLTLILAAFAFLVLLRPLPAQAAIASWQRGVTIYPNTTTDYASANFQQSVRNAAGTGVNYITLIIQLWQNSLSDSSMYAGYNTADDASLISGIKYIHSLGLQVSLNIHVDPIDNSWRADINPGNKAAWFAAYQGFEVHYAQIAETNKVESMILGTEMYDVSDPTFDPQNTGYWNTLIAAVRGVYSGLLSYSAQPPPDHSDLFDIAFWNKLDFVGISSYFSIAPGVNNPNQAQMQSSWQYIDNNTVKPIHNQTGKQVVFTEIGYRSVDDAHSNPWLWTPDGNVNLTEQANDYQALFSYWPGKSYFGGLQLWDWLPDPNAGGSGNNDYTPQNKPAQDIMSQYFKGNGVPTPTPPPLAANFNFSALLNPAQPLAGQNLAAKVSVTPDQSVSNILIDIEFYNSQNQKVGQQYFSSQNLNANQATNFTVNWVPPAAGNYSISAGIFSNDWGTNYNWSGNVLNFSVLAPGGTPTPSPTPTPTQTPSPTPTLTPSPTPSPTPVPPANLTLSIWWPASGGYISGLQPFKARVEGLALSSYSMYWSVDNGILNSMGDNNTDGPHKEALVSVSGWNWAGGGPYHITFTAKNSSGKILIQQTIQVYVTG